MLTLFTFIAQAHAKDLAASLNGDAQDSMDMLTDKLIDKLVDKLFSPVIAQSARAAARPAPFLSRPLPRYQPQSSVQAMGGSYMQPRCGTSVHEDNLKRYGIGSSPLEKLALSAMDATNTCGNRDVSVKAVKSKESKEAYASLATDWTGMDDKTKEKLTKVLDQVKEKESLLAGFTRLGYFDPLGFSTNDPVDGGKLLFYREVELKHGRVAMLAALGIVVGEQYHPLFGGDIDVPAYVAFQQTPLQNFWPAVVAAIAIPEIFSVFQFQDPFKEQVWAMKLDHKPGDLGFDPLGLKPTDPKELRDMQTKELNNGRLAMIAAAGMIAQELATGQKLF